MEVWAAGAGSFFAASFLQAVRTAKLKKERIK
jgi:hypothetical protein